MRVESTTDTKATAKVLARDGTEIGEICMVPWEPTSSPDLIPVMFSPPCQVVLTAYHHQHALYVRPSGRVFQEQFFTLLQKVAAVHVTCKSHFFLSSLYTAMYLFYTCCVIKLFKSQMFLLLQPHL